MTLSRRRCMQALTFIGVEIGLIGVATVPAVQAKRHYPHATPTPTPTPIPTPVPTPTATPPSGATVIRSTDKIAPLLAAGVRSFALHAGTYREAFGSTDRHEAGVSIVPFGDGPVIFDGTGLDQHFVYLGSGASWTLGAIVLQGFRPTDSGIVGVGDGCTLETLAGFTITGYGAVNANSHGIYFHGTGTGKLTAPVISKVPGAALHCYRGSPVVTVTNGQLGSLYESSLVGSGSVTFTDTAFTEPLAAWDLQIYSDSTGSGSATLVRCTGTGPNGAVRQTT